MAKPTPQSTTILRVAAAWGTTVLAAKSLLVGESLVLGDEKRRDLLVRLAIVSSSVLHVGLFGLIRALTTPPPIPKPAELSNPDEIAARFGVQRAFIEEPPPPVATGPDTSGGTGVKDP